MRVDNFQLFLFLNVNIIVNFIYNKDGNKQCWSDKMDTNVSVSNLIGKNIGLLATKSGIISGTIWISNILHSEDTDKDIQFSLADELSHYLYDYNPASKGYSNTYRTDEVQISGEDTKDGEPSSSLFIFLQYSPFMLKYT